MPADLDALAEHVGGTLDGVLHAIGFAPESCLGGGFLDRAVGRRRRRAPGLAYSLKALAVACRPLMASGGSIVGLDFDNSRVAWPVYDWMGVAKAAFESTARYLARDLGPAGIRVNLVAAGPIRTIAARSIPGFEQFEDGLGPAGAARMGRQGPRARRGRVRRAALRPVPRDDRRGDPRRRRLPRDRRLTRTGGGSGERAAVARCARSRPPRRRHEVGQRASRRGGRHRQHQGRGRRESSAFTASCRAARPTPT